MSKFRLRSEDMSASAYVEETKDWASALTRAESRFPGDYGPAMERVARKAGVPPGLLWRLRYRTPKSIATEHYAALGAYFASQQSRYRAERAAYAPKTALGAILLRAADFVAGETSRTSEE